MKKLIIVCAVLVLFFSTNSPVYAGGHHHGHFWGGVIAGGIVGALIAPRVYVSPYYAPYGAYCPDYYSGEYAPRVYAPRVYAPRLRCQNRVIRPGYWACDPCGNRVRVPPAIERECYYR